MVSNVLIDKKFQTVLLYSHVHSISMDVLFGVLMIRPYLRVQDWGESSNHRVFPLASYRGPYFSVRWGFQCAVQCGGKVLGAAAKLARVLRRLLCRLLCRARRVLNKVPTCAGREFHYFRD